jgi:hypothetical protein
MTTAATISRCIHKLEIFYTKNLFEASMVQVDVRPS